MLWRPLRNVLCEHLQYGLLGTRIENNGYSVLAVVVCSKFPQQQHIAIQPVKYGEMNKWLIANCPSSAAENE